MAINISDPVKIKFRNLRNGVQGIYLEIRYNGDRFVENLKLYILPGTSTEIRTQNAETLRVANAIKAQRIMEIVNGEFNLRIVGMSLDVTLLDWMYEYIDNRKKVGRDSAAEAARSTVDYIKQYNPDISLSKVDKSFIEGFVSYLENVRCGSRSLPMAKSTIAKHCSTIRAALNLAVKFDQLRHNPIVGKSWASISAKVNDKREYLTMEEVNMLIKTPCRRDDVKRTFLFACFTGLRISDVRNLKWKEVIVDGEKMHIELTQTKTDVSLYLPLGKQAQEYLPKSRGGSEDKVFSLCCDSILSTVLKEWVKDAGISKKVTFHVARHTFATMTLTTGSDIYTTSQLLGHSDVAVTQIYGKIIDKKKIAATYLIDKLFEED
jgi:integrase